MIKLEFPHDDKELARLIGGALMEYGKRATADADTTCFGPPVDEHTAPTENQKPFDFKEGFDPGTAPETLSEQGAQLAAEKTAADDRVDGNGVGFHTDYCANAADPFYKSGKNAGQWKKKKGVGEAMYNEWYAGQLSAGATSLPADEPADFDTTQAFGGGTPADTPEPPADAGQFMVWVSEMTTAGHITQADVTAAYAAAGVTVADVFAGADAAQHLANLHAILSAKVPA